MAKSARSDPGAGWVAPALGIVAAVTLLRVALLALNRTDLFVDEAQYWLWGQTPTFGYFSKPPMIAWVIGAVTWAAGSDAPFWVRLPAPLFHAATSMILGTIAAGLYGRHVAILVAAGFVTLPMVAVGSLLISTDTIMFPFLALALLAWVRAGDRPSTGLALACGIALGLAALSKYAALYYLPCAAMAALLVPGARRPPGFVAVTLLALAVTLSPNLIWNAANGFATLEHTLDNADWVRDPGNRAGLNPTSLAEFFLSQFVVFGPVTLVLLLGSGVAALRPGAPARLRMLVLFSLPILTIVCGQALLSRAYANWAVAAYLAGTLVAFAAMARGPRWLVPASFALNGVLCLVLPLATTMADRLTGPDGRLLLARYVGQAEMTRQIITTARAQGVTTIVARDRSLLADLFYTGRDTGLAIYTAPSDRAAPHHYAKAYPYPGGPEGEKVLWVGFGPAPEACTDPADPPIPLDGATGTWAGRGVTAQRVRADCWDPAR